MFFKVFRQLHDHSFLEIALMRYENDAHKLLDTYHSGMITQAGVVVKTKNLTHEDTPALIPPIDFAAQP